MKKYPVLHTIREATKISGFQGLFGKRGEHTEQRTLRTTENTLSGTVVVNTHHHTHPNPQNYNRSEPHVHSEPWAMIRRYKSHSGKECW